MIDILSLVFFIVKTKLKIRRLQNGTKKYNLLLKIKSAVRKDGTTDFL